MDYTDIDLKELCVNEVSVSSWSHSGPVSVDLNGIWLERLVDKLNKTGKVKAEILSPEDETSR